MTVRVAYLQSYGRTKSLQWAERQQFETRMIPARRGNIYDRNGVLMAGSVQTLAVYVDPVFMNKEYQKKGRNLNQRDEDLRKLAKIVEVDADKLIDALEERFDSRYAKIVENQSEQTCRQIEKLNIPGVGVEPMFVRFYPMGSTAAHVLGSCGGDGQGLEGIELKFQKELAGKKRLQQDRKRRRPPADRVGRRGLCHSSSWPAHCSDPRRQHSDDRRAGADRRLWPIQSPNAAKWSSLDPKTGDVLALANFPDLQPAEPGDSKPEDRRNAAIMMPYEPGSTIKPFIVGPALALKVTRPEEVWRIPTNYNPYGSRIIKDTHYYGPLTTWDILVKSSNIGDCLIAERMAIPRCMRV